MANKIIIPKNYKTLKFCEVNNGEYAPEICNEFASELLPAYLRNIDL